MKKVVLLLMLVVTAMAAKAEIGEVAVGLQTVYGTDTKVPGVGFHVKYNTRHHARFVWSANYNFKKNGCQGFDTGFDYNYLFYVGDNIRIYPLVGGMMRTWFWKETELVGAIDITYSDAETRLGLNGGAGIDYVLSDHFILNFETKYQYIKDASQAFFSLGASYRF